MGKGSRRNNSVSWEEFNRADDWRVQRDRDVVERASRFKPLTKNQEAYVSAIEKSTVTLAAGPPGSGKTFVACGVAVKMLTQGLIDRIVLSRPLLTCDEELGILKGDMNEKVQPYLAPLIGILSEMLPGSRLREYMEDETITICPLAVMRGLTFKKSFVILDEANNATLGQLRMFLTRFGEGSKVVACGDFFQSDLKNDGMPPFYTAMKALAGNKDIATIQLTDDDVVRHPLITWIDNKLYDAQKATQR